MSETALLHDAAIWQIRLIEDPAVVSDPAFRAWLREPRNTEAFERVSEAWALAGESLLLSEATADHVEIEVEPARPLVSTRRMMAMAACCLVAAGLGIAVQQNVGAQAYVNGPGDVQVVRLDDGSRARLDANTELRVGYRWWRRDIELVRGQASFEVAHDARRPFVVAAGEGIVTARGTRFNVNRLRDGFVVTLMEGKVDVASAKAAVNQGQPFLVRLRPGEQLAVHAGDRPALRPIDVRDATAWERHRIVFHDVTLGEAVEQLNHYSAPGLRIDPAVSDLRLSGVFATNDVARFVDAIVSFLPVEIDTDPQGRAIIVPRFHPEDGAAMGARK